MNGIPSILLAGLVLVGGTAFAQANELGLLVNNTNHDLLVRPMGLLEGPNTAYCLTLFDAGKGPAGIHVPTVDSFHEERQLHSELKRSEPFLLPAHSGMQIQILYHDQHAETLHLLVTSKSGETVIAHPTNRRVADFGFEVVYTCNKAGEQTRSFLALCNDKGLPFRYSHPQSNLVVLGDPKPDASLAPASGH